MYTFNSRVRFSETDSNHQLNLFSLINYFQDCSTFHSESINQGFSYLQSQNRVWLLNSWQIKIYQLPLMGEDIIIGTWPYDFKAFFGYRNFIMKDMSHHILAVANSIWVHMDINTLRPAKFDIASTGYEIEPPYRDMDYSSRKIELPSDFIQEPSFIITKSSIDTNSHVNNAQYIKMALEYLPENFKVEQLRAEYKKSALLGDLINPKTSFTNNIFTVIIGDNNNSIYSIIEFQGSLV